MLDAVVIGSGVGGLSAAIWLAGQGARVQVFEAAPRFGGKAGVVEIDGVRLDTGPSLLTLPEVFAELFRAGGASFEDQVRLVRPDLAFRYLFADGVALDVHHDLEATLESVRRTLGARAREQFAAYVEHAGVIWRLCAPTFVAGPAPSLPTLLTLAIRRPRALLEADALRSLWQAISDGVEDPHLRLLLARYATYNGSNPYAAPATLGCIAHVELALGGYGVEGGIQALIQAMVRVAQGLGVTLTASTPVRRILVEGGAAVGVELVSGDEVRAEAVIANADVGHVVRQLLPAGLRHGLAAPEPASMSGWTAILRARREGPSPRPAHTVVFPANYADEFRDIFERGRPPDDPTVYVCAPVASHAVTGWAEEEPLFVMANAPAEPAAGPSPPETWSALEARVRARLIAAGIATAEDPIVWRRTPADLARAYPGTRGAIYGAASNDALAAFRRAENAVRRVPGLYLASGSAHPGGGLPLCALSGRAAALAVLERLETRRTGRGRARAVTAASAAEGAR